jgi:hypothetical protein
MLEPVGPSGVKSQAKEQLMSPRALVPTALIAACVSSVVTLTVALLVLPPVTRAAPESQAVQAVVRAEQFEVVGADGAVVARLGPQLAPSDVLPDGNALVFFDREGRPRVGTGLSRTDVPGIVLVTSRGLYTAMAEGQSRGGEPSGNAFIVLADPARETLSQPDPLQISMSLNWAGGATDFYIRQPNGSRVYLDVAPDGSPRLQASAANGQTIWQVP